MSLLAGLTVALIVIAGLAAGYGALAFWLARRLGLRALFPAWIIASALATGAFVIRLGYVQRGVASPAAFTGPFPTFWMFLPFWALGLLAVTLYVARRHRRGSVAFTTGVAARSIGVFLLGVLVWSIAFAAWDIRRLFL